MHVRTRRIATGFLFVSLAAASAFAGAAAVPGRTVVTFDSDPLASSEVVLEGAAIARLGWNDDPPAFPGDRPGSLTALYDSRLAAGRVGWPLSRPWTHRDTFTAAAVFVIEPEGFTADPFGFFQISWGLWNASSTGLERTGTPEDFAGDTFELIESAWFPNVSPFFGGPFLTPTVFGAARTDDPLFDLLGSFVNVAFGASQASLPLSTPLVSVLEHRPDDGVLVASVHRLGAAGGLEPVPGASAVLALDALALREYVVDTVGLTLWRDGFGGDPPSVRAELTVHAVVALPAAVAAPEELLRASRTRP